MAYEFKRIHSGVASAPNYKIIKMVKAAVKLHVDNLSGKLK